VRRFLSRVSALFRRGRLDRELDDEIEAHLDLAAAEYRARGLSPDDARMAALRRFGGVAQVKEVYRDARGFAGLEAVAQDLRYAWRSLRKSPGFAAVAISTLMLAIGANTALFSVVYGVLIRPLPYPDPSRLVRVWHVPPAKSFPGLTRFSVSAANYIDWERQNHVFERMAIYGYTAFNVTGDRPESIDAATVSPHFFSVLGVQPMLGRTFLAGEQVPGRDRVVVLGYAIWRSRFGADRSIVGRTVSLDGIPYAVVGVMPDGFRFPDWGQMWTPLAWTPEQRTVRGNHNYLVIARLRRDATVERAQAEMNTISTRLQRDFPEDNAGWGAVVLPLHRDLVEDVRPALLMLLGAVACVLLIACANVANLVLARTLDRQRELAVRSALGAGRGRLVRQVLAEVVLLSLAGGALGLLVAHSGTGLIVRFLGDRLPRSATIGTDLWVLAFTLAVSVATGVLAGLLPAWRLTRRTADVSTALRHGSSRTSSEAGGVRTRGVLVACEVALALVLLIGAGLMIRSLWALRAVNPGFDARNVLTLRLPLSAAQHPTPQEAFAFCDRVLRRVRMLPGVRTAGMVDVLPMTGGGSIQPVAFEGRPIPQMADQPEVPVRLITPGFLESLRVPLRRGRLFTEADEAGRPPVVVISESMARRFWPHEDAVGRRLQLSFVPGVWREVVGVVGDVKLDGLDESTGFEALFMPLGQFVMPAAARWRGFEMSAALLASSPSTLAGTVSVAVHEKSSATRWSSSVSPSGCWWPSRPSRRSLPQSASMACCRTACAAAAAKSASGWRSAPRWTTLSGSSCARG
jgi:predicted permease